MVPLSARNQRRTKKNAPPGSRAFGEVGRYDPGVAKEDRPLGRWLPVNRHCVVEFFLRCLRCFVLIRQIKLRYGQRLVAEPYADGLQIEPGAKPTRGCSLA